MSAFLCDPLHVAFVARAVAPYVGFHVKHVAQELAAMNVESLAHRYGESMDAVCEAYGGMQGYHMAVRRWNAYPTDMEEAANRAFRRDLHPFPENEWIARVLKLAACLRYQSCESPRYSGSFAERALDEGIAGLMGKLPGFAEGPWELVHEEVENAER